MANTLSIAQSGLNAAQAGLSTTGQNIANANSVGYSRQTIVQGSVGGSMSSFGGTEITDVKRAYDAFLNIQRLSAQSNQSLTQVQFDLTQTLDKQFSDTSVGLPPMLQNVFSSLQDLSLAPNDVSKRAAFFDSTKSLLAEFHNMDQQFEIVEAGLREQLQNGLTTIDSLAKQIVTINKAINSSQNPDGSKPNDLYDKRDQLVLELSKQVKVSFVTRNDNYDLYIGSGQPLVVSNQVFCYHMTRDPGGADTYSATYTVDGEQKSIGIDNISGGEVGGILDISKNVIAPLESKLNSLAKSFADQFNQINTSGRKADGTSGSVLFHYDIPHIGETISLVTTDPNALATASAGSGSPGVGDNSNVLNMINLQNSKVVDNNTLDYQQAFTQMVTFVGSKAREYQLTNASANTVLQQTNDSINNVSGVNLDEEAANLIRYQQAYQAAGKIIQIFNEMFASLLQL